MKIQSPSNHRRKSEQRVLSPLRLVILALLVFLLLLFAYNTQQQTIDDDVYQQPPKLRLEQVRQQRYSQVKSKVLNAKLAAVVQLKTKLAAAENRASKFESQLKMIHSYLKEYHRSSELATYIKDKEKRKQGAADKPQPQPQLQLQPQPQPQPPPPPPPPPSSPPLTASSSSSNHVPLTVATKTTYPFRMSLHRPLGVVSQNIQRVGIWEPGITKRFEQVFSSSSPNQKKPRRFMDVGTNIGYYSLLAASFGVQVISIEAMEYNLERYRESIALNHFEHLINIHHVGVSNTPGGYLCMRMPEGNAGNGVATFSPTECKFSDHRDIKNIWKSQVAVKTLDEITTAAMYDSIIAIKLDIEGFETNALLGGKLFLKRVKPCYIWFEYTREAVVRSGRQPNDIFILLEELGYLVYDIATPEKIVHSSQGAFLEARHRSCPYMPSS